MIISFFHKHSTATGQREGLIGVGYLVYLALFCKESGKRARGKYEEWLEGDKLILLEGWARNGLTGEQIAHNMGISYSTFKVWKNKYPSFSAAIKRGNEVVDILVENALLKRALGYSYNEDKYIMVSMEQEDYEYKREAFVNEYKYNHPEASLYEIERIKSEYPRYRQVLVERKTKEVAPDVTAQIFWLKNRRPADWRDKRDISSHVEIETDGFMDALKGQVKDTFKDAGGVVEE